MTRPSGDTQTRSDGGRPSRGLVWAVVILALAVLGLGAWVLYSQTAEDDLAVPPDVQVLIDDWWQALERGDGSVVDLYLASGHHLYGAQAFRGSDIAAHLQQGDDHRWTTDPVLIVEDGGRYVVAAGVSNQLGSTWWTSAITFEIVTTDEGLRFAHTAWSKIS